MIGQAPAPGALQLIKHSLFPSSNKTLLYPSQKKSPPLLLSRSSWSMWLIIRFWLQKNNQEKVELFLPEYICNDFLTYLDEFNIIFHYYPVSSDLTPDWEWLNKNEKEIDIFILVHYFGHQSDVEKTRKFCKKQKCLFVEDASHVLTPTGAIGKNSDFTFYSPYKLLPIPDGSSLNYKLREQSDKELLLSLYKSEFPNRNNVFSWIIKKIIQVFIPQFIYNNFLFKSIPFEEDPKADKKTAKKLISSYSESYLSSLSESKIKMIISSRRTNYALLKNGLNLNPLLPLEGNECPYFFDHFCSNSKEHYQRLAKGFLFPGSWPDLPKEIIKTKANQLRENLITIPLHQDIPHKKILKKISHQIKKSSQKISINWDVTESLYKKLFLQIKQSNLLQSWDYGEAKGSHTSDIIRRGIIISDGKEIGLVQGIEKKIPLLKSTLFRINRGPLFIESDIKNDLKINTILEIYKKHSLLSIAPEIKEEALQKSLPLMNIHRWSKKSHSSIWVNLEETEEKIRSNLHSKWRNTLKSAEKNDLEIEIKKEAIENLIKSYRTQQEGLNFQGIPESIILNLNKSESLTQFHAMIGNQIISSIVIATHGRSCTYLIGWNSEQGKELKANYLLLWQAIIKMKELGLIWFDLGGIDEVLTPKITKFKRGISSDEYHLCGEYLKLF